MLTSSIGAGAWAVVSACALAALTPGPRALAVGVPAPAGGRCATATPTAIVAPPGEPGQPLLVRGTVFQPDGATPAAGAFLYVYQTDATGIYGPDGAPPRLRAWLRTDAQGRYEYRTIRPAPYPGRTIQAHIHTQLWGAGIAPQWNRDLLFADDGLVLRREREESATLGRFQFVVTPTREGDTLVATHDLRAKARGDAFEANIRHGLDACR
jgi:protocatechuate 3,4-dioxygenase beta subunit